MSNSPTPDQLAVMGDAELLNTLLAATAQLHQRLAKLTTGDGWQRYLALPDDALPPPSPNGQVHLGLRSLQATLERFAATRNNAEYDKIRNLPEFAAAHLVLAEVVKRYSQPRLEAKPTPSTAPPLVGRNSSSTDETESTTDGTESTPALPTEQPGELVSPEPVRNNSGSDGDERSILRRP